MNENVQLALKLLPIELWNTVYMVFASGFFALLFGIPLGVVLILTQRGGLSEKKWLYNTLGALVNVGRSIPFAILMVAIIPFTRLIVGTSLGTTASIVPLTLAAIPFVARMVENALKEVPSSIVESALVMGAKKGKIVSLMLAEAFPCLLLGTTFTLVTLVGYSAMAGLVGGGGLGKIAIQYGYLRFNGFMMITTLVLLLLLVEAIQWLGHRVARAVYVQRGETK